MPKTKREEKAASVEKKLDNKRVTMKSVGPMLGIIELFFLRVNMCAAVTSRRFEISVEKALRD